MLEAAHTKLDVVNHGSINYSQFFSEDKVKLELTPNTITRVPHSILNNPKLTQYWQNLNAINLDNNNITHLKLYNLPCLKGLSIANNKLARMTIQNMPLLTILDCSTNNLLEINLENFNSLKELDCDENKLNSIKIR